MNIQVDLHMNCSYTNQLIRQVLEEQGELFQFNPTGDECHQLYWLEYEDLDFDLLYHSAKQQTKEKKILANSFCIRKGLLRKANFAAFLQQYLAKKSDSILRTHYLETHILELAHPDYLDEALNEAFELRDILEENIHSSKPSTSFILKASMLDKASELFLFSTQAELEEFFTRNSNEEEDEDESISHVREWVVQRYLTNPKLLPIYGNRKFHLRVYVVAESNLRVYVYDGILALFASLPYQYDGQNYDRLRHITNTCAQTDSNVSEDELVKEFWTLEGINHEKIFEQIKMITQEIFTGLHPEISVFQPLKNAFEIYGFDYLIDENDQVYFLEANAYPDFKQTGNTLSILIKELFENVVDRIILPYFQRQPTTSKSPRRQLHLVYDKQKNI